MIVIDTDVLIEILDRGSSGGDAALEEIRESGDDVVITAMTLHEILYGLERRKKVAPTLDALRVLPYTATDAKLAARIEARLESAGQTTGRFDCMIAATTINAGGRLFTFNRKHFEPMKKHGLELA